jgi:hypothetical protein
MPPSTPSAYPRFSQSQYAWALLGLVVLVLTLVLALANLQSIYQAQKDFLVGSLLSLTGFCFGKALSRTQEQKAIALIRTAPTRSVVAALDMDRTARLHADGLFQQLSLLARNLEAAVDRISEYYDSQARRSDFYRQLPLLRVALDDLDKANANVINAGEILGSTAEGPAYVVSPAVRLSLTSIRRDLRESLGRRDQSYEWFAARLERPSNSEFWDVFDVMTSDALKADRLLDALLGQHVAFPLEELLVITVGYLAAAIRRANEVGKILHSQQFEKPKIFDVMVEDLDKALDDLGRIDVREPRGTAGA